LRPLVGLPAPRTDREENHTAWTRFLEDVARARPTVLVIEDVHWASGSTLAFLRHFVRHAAAVPLLLVSTARPEFLEAPERIDEAAALEFTRIDLRALDPEESARLASELTVTVGTAELTERIAAACGGNPLFAEELARYLCEREASTDEEAGLPRDAPSGILALIAARLDALPMEQKALLADAAVVGSVFWPRALHALGTESPAAIDAALRLLEAREFVRRSADVTVAGEPAYVFWHALTRDVAYEALPRMVRAEKHAAAADWIETDFSPHIGDFADLLADHRLAALELARTSGASSLAAAQLEPAIAALTLAGDRTMTLDVTAAEARYARAAELTPRDSALRPEVLRKWGRALMNDARLEESIRTFQESMALSEDHGLARETAVAATDCSTALFLVGDTAAAVQLHRKWIPVLEVEGATPELLTVLTSWIGLCGVTGDVESARAATERAQAVAAELGQEEPLSVLLARAYHRCLAGDHGGLDDYRGGLERAKATGDSRKIGAVYFNLGADLAQFEGPRASLQLRREGLALCAQRHDRAICYSLRYGIAHDLHLCGEWAAAMAEIEELEPLLESAGNHAELGYLRALATVLLHETSEFERAQRYLDELMEVSYGPGETLLRAWTMVAAALLHAARDDRGASARALRDCFALANLWNELGFDWLLPTVVRLAADIGDEHAHQLVRGVPADHPLASVVTPTTTAIHDELCGRTRSAEEHFAAAAIRWANLGVPFESALARLGEARCLAGLGRGAEAATVAAATVETLTRLGAQTALAEARRLAGSL
jgi:tetratricopeptide (TPR) repeat protein